MFVTMWSVQPLSTSRPAVLQWVRAVQCSSSGKANVGPMATVSCLPPSVWLLHALSRWPCSPQLLHCAVSFVLQSLEKCPGIPHTKQFPFLDPFLKSRSTASATEPLCPLYRTGFVAVLSCKFCSLFLNSVKYVAGWKLSCIKKFHISLANHWAPRRWRVSLRLLPLLLEALWATPVLWWRNYPNTQNLRAAVEQAVPPRSPLLSSPHYEIPLAKASKPSLHLLCHHLSHSHVSSAWGLLHLESAPDGTTHSSFSPWCLQLPSHKHPSAPCGSSSHHCSPHWLVMHGHWIAPLSHVMICIVPLSA